MKLTWNFSGLNFTTAKVVCATAPDDQSNLHIILRSSNTWNFIYSLVKPLLLSVLSVVGVSMTTINIRIVKNHLHIVTNRVLGYAYSIRYISTQTDCSKTLSDPIPKVSFILIQHECTCFFGTAAWSFHWDHIISTICAISHWYIRFGIWGRLQSPN